jgi:hypothetical protein
MPLDIAAAEQFVYANARLLERHRLAVLLDGAPVDPVIAALWAYRNPDGGFGNALEPDVRCPGSQTAATLQALEVLGEVGARSDPMVDDAAAWAQSITEADGGVPTVLPSAAGYPRAPWMEPSQGSGFLTYALAAQLWHAGSSHPWLSRATEWCWADLAGDEAVGGYTAKFAADFLNAVPDQARVTAAVDRLRPALDEHGFIPVPGGTENERLTPLDLSPWPEAACRTLFTDAQIDADLDRLEAGQLDDGGWTVDYLAWSPGQALEWRGIITLHSLSTLRAYGRLRRSR